MELDPETERALSERRRDAAAPARSLFGEILDWMLAPLFLLWPAGVAITYVVAQSVSVIPYDRSLASSVLVLAQQVKDVNGRPRLQLPVPARDILLADETDSVFYRVRGGGGEHLGGDRGLPLPALEQPLPGIVQFRDDTLRGFGIRVAYTWVELPSNRGTPPVLVQVAETLEKRSRLANDIVRGVVIPQFVVLPLAVLLVWFGLTRGLMQLSRLQARLRARRPDDLSPLDVREAPQEIAPLVDGMNDLLQRLSASVDAQKRFVADAAHQLKTPLAGIRTQAELALRTPSQEDRQACLRQLIEGAGRATRLVNQLLALARAEDAAKSARAAGRADLVDIARDQTQQRVPDALARRIDLGLESDHESAAVAGDALLLAELLGNLLDNALRYTPAGGTVTVRVDADADGVHLRVEDSGPGIPPAERERVFGRFYRILGTAADGSGLGLAIVREIASQHGARVTLDATDPRPDADPPGTRVTITFPPPAGEGFQA